MASRVRDKQQRREQRLAQEAERERARRARQLQVRLAGAVIAAVVVLGVIFALNNAGGGAGHGKGGRYAFAVGSPGPGQQAPPVTLQSTSGGTFDLAAQRGKSTLLYFQEGLTCQPCWDQIKDLQKQQAKLTALGVTQVVSVTTDGLSNIRQKVSDDGISIPVLSDPDLAVSKSYNANQYGMMGTSRDGHSFVLVGPDGRIVKRMDYGGPPNYTMYVPVASLLADLGAGSRRAAS
jgi:peroxiredoxin Q/BCP